MRQLAQMITSTSIVARLGIGWCVCVCVCIRVHVAGMRSPPASFSDVLGRGSLVGMERAYTKAFTSRPWHKFMFTD